jgi:hypothetical protein
MRRGIPPAGANRKKFLLLFSKSSAWYPCSFPKETRKNLFLPG